MATLDDFRQAAEANGLDPEELIIVNQQRHLASALAWPGPRGPWFCAGCPGTA